MNTMTIDEAIKIKEQHLANNAPYDWLELEQADRLGLEALKAVDSYRKLGPSDLFHKLPGETEE
ncbi:unnamed protein product [marine sediment metagenome]|uniref:Uncharacterized protein n=1 Tax=marine sediment metagenome TaxID=412755 RepID=X1RZL8_9ZZZZ